MESNGHILIQRGAPPAPLAAAKRISEMTADEYRRVAAAVQMSLADPLQVQVPRAFKPQRVKGAAKRGR